MARPLLFVTLFALFISCGNNENEKIYTGVLEGKAIQVPALSGGKINHFYFDVGQEVAAGDTLAQIDTTELFYQVQQIRAGLQELQVQEEIANTALQQAEEDLNYVKEKHQRIEKLVADQTVPQQNLDDLSNQLKQVQSRYQTARQNLRTLAAKRDQLQAQVNSVRKKIRDAAIIVPSQGIIFSKYFEEGEAVPPLNPIVELIHINEFDVKIYISETDLPHIKYGQEVRIRVDGLNRELPGKITWISPKAEFTPKTILTPETRTSLVYAVNITVANEDGIMKHGMPVEVVLQ